MTDQTLPSPVVFLKHEHMANDQQKQLWEALRGRHPKLHRIGAVNGQPCFAIEKRTDGLFEVKILEAYPFASLLPHGCADLPFAAEDGAMHHAQILSESAFHRARAAVQVFSQRAA